MAKPETTSTWKRILLPATLFLIAVTLSVGIGYVAATGRDDFNWDVAVLALTGLGTSLLAGATWWLAESTRDSVRDSEIEIQLTRESVAATQLLAKAQDRPFIVPTKARDEIWGGTPGAPEWRPIGFSDRSGEAVFTVRLWNIGSAAGVVAGIWLIHGYPERTQRIHEGREIIVDAQDRVADLELPVPGPFALPGLGEEATLVIQYRSASGGGYVTVSNVIFREDGECVCFGFVQSESEAVALSAASPVAEIPVDPTF